MPAPPGRCRGIKWRLCRSTSVRMHWRSRLRFAEAPDGRDRQRDTALRRRTTHRPGGGGMKMIVRIGAYVVVAVTPLGAATAPAFAGGKAAAGCANGGQQLAYYVTPQNIGTAPAGTLVGDLVNMPGDTTYESLNHDGLQSGLFASEGLDVSAIFASVDHNRDGMLCYKLP